MTYDRYNVRLDFVCAIGCPMFIMGINSVIYQEKVRVWKMTVRQTVRFERRSVLLTDEQMEFVKNAAKRRQLLMSQVLLNSEEKQYTTSDMLNDLLNQLTLAKRVD